MSTQEPLKTKVDEALIRRLRALSGNSMKRALQFGGYFGERTDSEGLDALVEEIAGSDSTRLALMLFVIVTGAYPSEQIYRRVQTIGTELGWATAIDWIKSCNEVIDADIEFASSGVAYDVTNTLISPVLTGIQRVVYELGRRLWQQDKPVFFFSVKAGLGPTILSEEHAAAFLEKYKPSSKPLISGEKAFDAYELLEASANPTSRGRGASLKLAVRARAKAAYEFAKIYVFPPALHKSIATGLARMRVHLQRRREEAAIPRAKNEQKREFQWITKLFGGKGRGGSRKTVAWFEDCNLLVAELFSPMRSDIYPPFLAAFKSSTIVIHDVIPISHPQYCVESVVAAHVGYLRVTAMFDRVVPVSRATGGSYSDFILSAFGTLPQVDPVLLPNFMGEIPPRQLGETSVPRVCCFSTMEPRKGHWRVLEACEKLWNAGAEFELVLIGGSGWKSDELIQRIEFLREKGRPILRNRRFLDDHEVGLIIRTCLCSIFCSEVEGFGLPVVESLALGVPVICADVSSMSEIIEATKGCYPIDPFSLESISNAISQFIEGDVSAGAHISLDGLLSANQYVEEVARFPVA